MATDYGTLVWPSSTNNSVGANNANIPAYSTLVAGSDGTKLRPLSVDSSGVLNVTAGSLPLPSGAATAANQTNGLQKTQLVDPGGNQITSTANALDVHFINSSIEAIQLGTWTVGISQTTPGTTNAISLAQIGSTTVATGNGVVGAGVQRVAIASDNSALSVNAAQSGTWNINNISGTVSLPTGASTSANQTSGSQKTQISDSTGTAVTVKQLSNQVVSTDYGLVTNTVMHGLTTGGGGGYVDVKVTPSGSLTVDASGSSVTVSGTVAATQSGTWGVGLNAGSNLVGKVGVDQTTPGTTNGVSLAYVNSTAVATGNGVVGTGVQRVAIASDNTAFGVNAAQSGTWNVGLNAGSNLVGKFGIDQTTPGTTNAISLAQVGSTTVATGNGVAGTGVQRVTIASDNTAFSVNAAQSGTWNIGTLTSITNAVTVTGTVAATQSGTWGVGLNAGSNLVGKVGIDQTTPGTTNAISLAQVGSTTVATGNGVAGTGVQRVTIASDNTAFTVNAAQSGTWTVQPGNTANTTAWLITQNGRSTANASAYNDYTSTSVTTSAYVQLVASTSNAVSEVEIFDSSGQGMILATGGAGSETDQIYIFPGGNGRVPLKIAASTRVAIKAKTANATSGYIMVNFYA